jgi:multisubunit Na+/H+ antiporter MnhB subunit
MSRNFYILAATLLLFALISGVMSMLPSSLQPGLPANGTLWRTMALILLVAGLGAALIGMLTHLFEQVDRHSEDARRDERRRRRSERN